MKKAVNRYPGLRFPEFKGEYANRPISDVFVRVSDAVDVAPQEWYQEIGIRSHGKGIFHKAPVQGETLGNKRVFWIKPNVFILNIVFAWEHAVAKTTTKEVGMIASHRFPMFEPKNGRSDINYFLLSFLTKKGKYLLGLASPGGAGRNKTLGQKAFNELKVFCPPLQEQQKIVSFFSIVEKKIEQIVRKKELLEKYKKGLMQKVFSQEIRFKDDNGQDYPEWEEKRLWEVCIGIKSGKTNPNEGGKYPVYGSTGKIGSCRKWSHSGRYILIARVGANAGTANYVNGKFGVTDNTLILEGDKQVELSYIFYALKKYNLKRLIFGGGQPLITGGQLKSLKLSFPTSQEQQKIANFLFTIDCKINFVQTQLTQTQNFKKGLLQKMFA